MKNSIGIVVLHSGFLSLLLIICSTSSAAASTPVVTIDVDEAKDLITSGYRYLDVRTEEEFKQGYISNSLNIPYMFETPQGRVNNPDFLEQVIAAYSKEDHIIVGCRSGHRSLSAASDLMNVGFKDVINMGGGYIEWVKHGFSVVKKKPTELEISSGSRCGKSLLYIILCKWR